MIERIAPSSGSLDAPGAPFARVPPHSLEAEMALLGSLLLDPEAVGTVVPLVQPDDFYKGAHRRLYEVIRSLFDRGDPADPLVVMRECERLQILDDIGGRELLSSLAASVTTSANAEHYAQIVREKSIARAVIRAAGELMKSAYDEEGRGDDLLEIAEHKIFEISRTKDMGTASSVRSILEETFRELDKRDGASTGIPTGFHQMDELTAGLHPGELIIIAGRPSMGKTTFALNVAYNVAVQAKVGVVVFSLEMSRQQITKNVLCSHAMVEAHKLRGGRFLDDAEYARLTEAAGPLYDAPLFVDDTPGLSTTSLRAKARRLKQKHDIGLIVIDYLQLMEAIGASKNVDSRQQEISYISRSLKGIARELSVPVIALSQLNRAADSREDHKPRLSDLRECVTGDTLVVLADGRRVPIVDLVGTEPEVLALDARQRLTKARSDKVWHVGRRPVFEICTETGHRIRATGRHRMLGARGWARIDELRAGDRLASVLPVGRVASPGEASSEPRLALAGAGRGGNGTAATWQCAPSRETLTSYAEILDDPDLLEMATNDLFWDRIVSIEPAGEEDVYDLTVPGPACWLADGLVSHNSGAIEQDADVICFLYRKHYYTKAESDRGLAEVVIAKQRNGPTDTVRLAFLDQFMRFDNLALGSGPV